MLSVLKYDYNKVIDEIYSCENITMSQRENIICYCE